VKVQDNVDVMITRDTARRASSLLGFAPSSQAKLASAAAVLAGLVLHTRTVHELNFNGVQHGDRIGVQVSTVVPWLWVSRLTESKWRCISNWEAWWTKLLSYKERQPSSF